MKYWVKKPTNNSNLTAKNQAIMKYLILSILTVTLIVICGCGKHTYYGELYKQHSKPSGISNIDKFHMRLIISESHPEMNKGILSFLLTDTTEKHGYPYTLLIASDFYGQTNDTVKIREIKLKIGDRQEVVLLSKSDDGMLITYKPWLEYAVTGNVALPLHDKLPFLEGQKVTVTVKYQPPDSSQIYEMKTVYVGQVTKRIYTSMDVLNSV